MWTAGLRNIVYKDLREEAHGSRLGWKWEDHIVEIYQGYVNTLGLSDILSCEYGALKSCQLCKDPWVFSLFLAQQTKFSQQIRADHVILACLLCIHWKERSFLRHTNWKKSFQVKTAAQYGLAFRPRAWGKHFLPLLFSDILFRCLMNTFPTLLKTSGASSLNFKEISIRINLGCIGTRSMYRLQLPWLGFQTESPSVTRSGFFSHQSAMRKN